MALLPELAEHALGTVAVSVVTMVGIFCTLRFEQGGMIDRIP